MCLIILNSCSKDLEKATEDTSRFFGQEWKHTTRNWGNYLSDLEQEYKTADNETEVRTLHELMCKAGAARKVLGAVSSHGMGSAKVLDVFDQHVFNNLLHVQ